MVGDLRDLVLLVSVFCIGMGFVTMYHQWKARPPIALGLILTIGGVLVLVGLVAEAAYRAPEFEARTALSLGGLMVTSIGLVMLTITTRIQLRLREHMDPDDWHAMRAIRARRPAAGVEEDAIDGQEGR